MFLKRYKWVCFFGFMKYEFDSKIQEQAEEISRMLFPHIQIDRIKCFKSFGTSSKRTIARCHALGKLMQKAIGIKAVYALEFLAERFDKLGEEEKIKVIIHELMHIPKTFGGGFKHHDYVCERNVNKCYKLYDEKKNGKQKNLFGF
jgi:predicted metallopeptidase